MEFIRASACQAERMKRCQDDLVMAGIGFHLGHIPLYCNGGPYTGQVLEAARLFVKV